MIIRLEDRFIHQDLTKKDGIETQISSSSFILRNRTRPTSSVTFKTIKVLGTIYISKRIARSVLALTDSLMTTGLKPTYRTIVISYDMAAFLASVHEYMDGRTDGYDQSNQYSFKDIKSYASGFQFHAWLTKVLFFFLYLLLYKLLFFDSITQ